MAFENWDEIRTAFHVARLGTVSGAAEVLGVHHATVIRHIDALEGRLGTRLFQRHARGYTPTDAGRALLEVAQATETTFAQLANRITGASEEMSGELIVTSIPGLTPIIMPTLARLQAEHPALVLHHLTDFRVLRLELGEAHIAIRAGQRPQDPDNVVQHLMPLQVGLFASRDYAARHGLPVSDQAMAGHRFIGPDDAAPRTPFDRWLAARTEPKQIVFRSNDFASTFEAIRAGIGLGFMLRLLADRDSDLIEAMPLTEEWGSGLWLVTHVDLHRTPKVQAAVSALKKDLRALAGA
jgi:DNA-binding transcriptional LysR family regulator